MSRGESDLTKEWEDAGAATLASVGADPVTATASEPEVSEAAEVEEATSERPFEPSRRRNTKRRNRHGKATRKKVNKKTSPETNTPAAAPETEAASEGPTMPCLTGIAPPASAAVPTDLFGGALEKWLGPAGNETAFACCLLTACSAAAAHAVRLDPASGMGHGGVMSLNCAVVVGARALPAAVMPVLQAAYETETAEVNAWRAEQLRQEPVRKIKEAKRRLMLQVASNAGLLGQQSIAVEWESVSADVDRPRPRFVQRDARPSALTAALGAAEKGLLLVGDSKMPTMCGFGVNYDEVTAETLAKASAGGLLELAAPDGCTRLRHATVATIGLLTTADVFSLHKVPPVALAATLFVFDPDKEVAFGTAAVAGLTQMLGRLRALEVDSDGNPRRLTLSAAAARRLERSRSSYEQLATTAAFPLSGYYAAAGNLTHRIAALLPLIDYAGETGTDIPREIGVEQMKRAVDFVDKCVMPTARAVLLATSIEPEVRTARRIASFAQQRTSAQYPILHRRDVVRAWQRSASVSEVDQALDRLVQDGILTPLNPSGSGAAQAFSVNEVVFETARRLPDLVTDGRRSSQA